MDDPHAEVEIKPQLKPGGSVAKEEDPKPSHQLQIKSTGSQADSVYGIYKRSLRAPTEGNALALLAVGTGGNNSQEEEQISV